MTGFQYAANNPIRFIDINGDSLSISSDIYANKKLNPAMRAFFNTKAGIGFLSKYAKSGQTFYGHTFNEDGKYHKKGINLNYKAEPQGKYKGGDTGTDQYSNAINITLNSDIDNSILRKENVFNSVKTIFHESFIHAELDAQDFTDDTRFNNSNIPSMFKENTIKVHYQHRFVRYNFEYNRTGYFGNEGFRGIKEASQMFKLNYSDNEIKQRMWKFNGGIDYSKDGKFNAWY
jgi:hypothetical protein